MERNGARDAAVAVHDDVAREPVDVDARLSEGASQLSLWQKLPSLCVHELRVGDVESTGDVAGSARGADFAGILRRRSGIDEDDIAATERDRNLVGAPSQETVGS
jgi:hypothetical protein